MSGNNGASRGRGYEPKGHCSSDPSIVCPGSCCSDGRRQERPYDISARVNESAGRRLPRYTSFAEGPCVEE